MDRSAGPAAAVDGGRHDFVGRAAQLQLLDDGLAHARGGRPVTLVVRGSAGMGKTALVRRWAAAVGDARVAAISGDEAEARLEFGLLRALAGARGTDPSALAVPGEDPRVVGSRLVERRAGGGEGKAAMFF